MSGRYPGALCTITATLPSLKLFQNRSFFFKKKQAFRRKGKSQDVTVGLAGVGAFERH